MTIPSYTEDYIEQCFFVWYQGNRGRGRLHAADGLPPSNDGNIPAITTILEWRSKYGWDERADALDAEVSMRLEKDAIEKKAETIKKVVAMLEDAVLKASEQIKKDGFDTSAAAVRMLLGGSEELVRLVGTGELLLAVSKMNDQQLTKEFYHLLGKDDNVIDVEAEVDDADSSPENDNGS